MSIKFKFKDGITIETIGKSNSTLDDLKQEAIKLHKQILEDRLPDPVDYEFIIFDAYVDRYLTYSKEYPGVLNENESTEFEDNLFEKGADPDNFGPAFLKYLKEVASKYPTVKIYGLDDEPEAHPENETGFSCGARNFDSLIAFLKELKVLKTDIKKEDYTNAQGYFDYSDGLVTIFGDAEANDEIVAKTGKISLSKSARGYKSKPTNLLNFLKKTVEADGAFEKEEDMIQAIKNQFNSLDRADAKELRESFQGNETEIDEWIKKSVINKTRVLYPNLVLVKESVGDTSCEDVECKDFFEPISSFKSFEFIDKTKQGFHVVKVYRDLEDDRMHVIAYRPSDNTYIICLGYSPETGTWNQGRYDFSTFRQAEKSLKNDYKVEEYEYDDTTSNDEVENNDDIEVEDTDEEVVIKKDSQEEDKDLTFRRGR